jgi:hypothetical protein
MAFEKYSIFFIKLDEIFKSIILKLKVNTEYWSKTEKSRKNSNFLGEEKYAKKLSVVPI